jgi:predicted ATPase
LLQGETGTGKGLVARDIHDSGPRAPGPFIEVNCAAIPDTLLEAELLGVEAGAFTDAKHAKPGLFAAAAGGTLFLDEIAALSLPLQGKCLTAIETKRVRRMGAVVEHPLDVKLIAATQVALGAQVQVGHCWSYGSTTPYLPVRDLLRAHCGLTPADSAETMAEKVRAGRQAVDLAADDWAPSLRHLLEIEPGTEDLLGVSPETLKAKTFEALRQLCLHRSPQHPLVLAVEDLQWIDPTSEEFFASLVERFPGAAILCPVTYRPGYRPPWLDKSYATQLTVLPLSPQDSVQVVQVVLRTETVPAPLGQAILVKAQGNPFFLEEIAQALVDQDTRRREGGMALPSALQLPATVQGMLAARIDRLPPEEKHLLQTAAVVGTEVPVPLAGHC